MASVWRRACVSCTKSKRQCTKSVPACRRCVDKGIRCLYPPARRTESLSIDTEAGAAAATSSSSSVAAESANPPLVPHNNRSNTDVVGALYYPPLQLTQADFVGDVSRSSPQPLFDDAAAADTWFLAPESWVADCTPPPMQPQLVQYDSLQRFVDCIQSWLRQWVTAGSSPLHHWYLYKETMPRHVQDAYTAITMYAARTPETQPTVSRVLDDRATQLLQDQALETTMSGRQMDVFDHLSRVQSLLVYQSIRLFDGDVRMRAQAEALIPALFLWSKQLLECAKDNLARPARFLASFATSNFYSNAGGDHVDDVLWRAWVLVESVRRTWLVANCLQETYLYMKRGWGECPGRVTFTMRAGLWEAPSPYAWSRACCERGTLFLLPKQTENLFFDGGPEDIDEFNLMILELSYGVERVERWLGEAKERREQRSSFEALVDVVGQVQGVR